MDGITALDSQVSYGGIQTWHKKGNVVQGHARTLDRFQADSGVLDVDMRPVFDAAGREIPGYRACTRTDGLVVGVHSGRYEAVNFKPMCEPIHALVDAGFAVPETAGTLWGGRTVWAQYGLHWQAEIVPGDVLEAFVLVSNAHDGSRTLQYRLTGQRVVCANTLAMADAASRKLLSARHTAGCVNRAYTDAKAYFLALVQEAERNVLSYRALAAHKLTSEQRVGFLAEFFPLAEKPATDTAQGLAAWRRAQSEKELFERLLVSGKGTEIDGVVGTGWGFLNATTEYVDHYAWKDAKGESRDRNVVFGEGARVKEAALEHLLQYVQAA